MRLLKLTLLTLALATLSACASHEVVPTKGPHSATTAANVKIYPKHPKRYERLALVQVPIADNQRWDESGNANATIDALKSQAAALGATGILLADIPSHSNEQRPILATAGYHGTFYQIPVRPNPRTALAYAIYVLEE